MQLLKKFFGRLFFIALSAVLQVLWFVVFIYLLGERYTVFAGFIRGASLLTAIWIINKRGNPSFKLGWVLLILALPVAGFSIYLFFTRNPLGHKFAKGYAEAQEKINIYMKEKAEDRLLLEAEDPQIAKQSRYLMMQAKAPVYRHTQTEYFPVGEKLFDRMVKELRKAKHFIFMEYFIIDNGVMWGTILDILEEKAKEGVDVRLIYDDVGCVGTLPANFFKQVRKRGIACEVFNPFRHSVSSFVQNRDHRKIMVIDGHTGFTGGINLADEYINHKQRFGYWKDSGICLRGEAVWSFTIAFLQMWSVITGEDYELSHPEVYRPEVYASEVPSWDADINAEDGYVQPYVDSPLDDETVGENVYLNMISQAKQYVYICTPYLIIDHEMMTNLCLAAKNGVDVKIILPGIPDKKLIYLTSTSYYAELIDAGVKIYRYIPGFLHAKTFVCDDEVATVGTINLDYRSLYLHFENGVWIYRAKAVAQMKEDILHTLEASEKVSRDECEPRNVFVAFLQSILKLLAPLL